MKETSKKAIDMICFLKGSILCLCLMFTLFSCQKEAEGLGSTLDISITSIKTALTTAELATKANAALYSDTLSLTAEDFTIEILTAEEVCIYRKPYTETIGQKIKVNAGEYTVRAYYGSKTAAGFSAYYMVGEAACSVHGQTSESVSLVCKPGNVKVAVAYGENIRSEHADFYTKVKLNASKSLLFSKDETRSGYIPAGALTVEVYTTIDGAEKCFISDPITCAAGDFITFNIDTKVIPTYGVTVSITIDSSTEDHELELSIPSYMKPKAAPSYTTSGFEDDNILSYIEGISTVAEINVNAPGELRKCTLNIASDYLIDGLGWPTEVNLLNIGSSTTSLFNRDGVVWTFNATDNATLAKFDLLGLTSTLKCTSASATDNVFTITATDQYDQTTTQQFTIRVNPPSLTMNAVSDFNIWATKLYDLSITTTNGNANLIKLQYSANGSTWLNAPTAPAVSGTTATVANLTGLTAGSTYYLRAKYHENDYLVSAPITINTETAAQVGNSGFEDWTDGTRYTQPYYVPYTTDPWWDSNNNETMQKSYSTYINYKCFPTTYYATSIKRSGSKCAQVMSVAVNGSNSEVAHWGDTQGKLFIGSMDDDANITEGHSFSSRPAQLRFWYQYTPNGSESFSATIELRNGSQTIGSGVFTASGSVSTWTQAAVDITYSNTQLKATSIYIIYLSSTSSSPGTSKQTITIPAGSKKVYCGSILSIDDMELIY